jgi:hypothetical protein
MKELYVSDCVNVYTDEAGEFSTVKQACDPRNCHRGTKITDLRYYGPCPNSVVENFQVFGKDSKNNSSVKIIIIISVIVILCLLGFLAYHHMNKKK